MPNREIDIQYAVNKARQENTALKKNVKRPATPQKVQEAIRVARAENTRIKKMSTGRGISGSIDEITKAIQGTKKFGKQAPNFHVRPPLSAALDTPYGGSTPFVRRPSPTASDEVAQSYARSRRAVRLRHRAHGLDETRRARIADVSEARKASKIFKPSVFRRAANLAASPAGRVAGKIAGRVLGPVGIAGDLLAVGTAVREGYKAVQADADRTRTLDYNKQHYGSLAAAKRTRDHRRRNK